MLNQLVSNFANNQNYENATALINYCYANGDAVDVQSSYWFDRALDFVEKFN